MKIVHALLFTLLCAGLSAGGHAQMGFVDTLGKVAIAPQFRSAEGFREGRALVTLADESQAFIDRKGKMVIPAVYLSAGDFSGGLAPVLVRSQ